jgi:hypothetical protein
MIVAVASGPTLATGGVTADVSTGGVTEVSTGGVTTEESTGGAIGGSTGVSAELQEIDIADTNARAAIATHGRSRVARCI